MAAAMDSTFRLRSYGNAEPQFSYILITAELVNVETVAAAWAYAVRYTAKGLDLPDHQAAMKLMLERHPSWNIVESRCVDIQVNLALAEKDVSEA